MNKLLTDMKKRAASDRASSGAASCLPRRALVQMWSGSDNFAA
jgi:hypothetical protein